MTTSGPFSRRNFMGIIAGAAVLGATACVPRRTDSRDLALGNSSQLRMLNWSDYIDPDLVPDLEQAIGLPITYDELWEDNYSGWELIEPELTNGLNPGYDIVVPTNWRAAQMVANGWVEQIPLEIVPNHVNIEPAYLATSWDRGARFHMPWQAGITGIAYNTEKVGREIRSTADLFSPEFTGRVGMIGEMREAVGMAMLASGLDPSNATLDSAAAGLDFLESRAAAGQFAGWYYDDYTTALQDGTVDIAMAWSGEAVGLVRDDPRFKFIVPDDGAIQWFDTMVIPTGSPNVRAAGNWMNLVYDPAIAAAITSYVGYISPVRGVRDALADRGGADAELADNPVLFPDAETARRLFVWDGLDADLDNEFDTQFAELLG